jgi:Zn-dependent protease
LDRFQVFLLVAPVLLFSMVAHEYAHGYAALRQGDTTARDLGRLTWNPVKHIDPVMTILVPILTFLFTPFIFGGAKPVPVNPRNYRQYRRGDIIVSMAGIAVNLTLAVACTLGIIAFGGVARVGPALTSLVGLVQAMLVVGVMINLVLAFFNLLPIPPLDGSHVFKYLLPPAWALHYQRIGFFGLLILVLFLPSFMPFVVRPVMFLLRTSTGVASNFFVPRALEVLRGAGFGFV